VASQKRGPREELEDLATYGARIKEQNAKLNFRRNMTNLSWVRLDSPTFDRKAVTWFICPGPNDQALYI